VLEAEKEAVGQTRIEPVHDPEQLTDGLDASNDPADGFDEETPDFETAALEGNGPVAEQEAEDSDAPRTHRNQKRNLCRWQRTNPSRSLSLKSPPIPEHTHLVTI
jgi:hypothetical protein